MIDRDPAVESDNRPSSTEPSRSAGGTEELLSPDLARRLDRLRLLVRTPRGGAMHGERRGPARGRSVELSDFRPYAEGDDPRQIDWRAYARMERLFIKLFVLEEDTTLHLLLDSSQSMAWGSPSKHSMAKRLAAAVGYVALGRQEWVTSTALTDRTLVAPRPVRGRAGVPSLLAALSAIPVGGGTEPRRRLVEYAAAAKRPGPLLLLSDLYGDGWRKGLDVLLSAGFEPTVIHILDPEELHPTARGDLLLRDDETGEHVPVSVDDGALAAYAEMLDAWRDGLASHCSGRGMSYVPLSTALDLDEVVLGIFRKRGLVG